MYWCYTGDPSNHAICDIAPIRNHRQLSKLLLTSNVEEIWLYIKNRNYYQKLYLTVDAILCFHLNCFHGGILLTISKRSLCQDSWSINFCTFVLRAPTAAVDVNMANGMTERRCLDTIGDITIQHTYTANFCIVCDPYSTHIIHTGCNFTGTPKNKNIKVASVY